MSSYQGHWRLIAFRVLNSCMFEYHMDALNSYGRGIQHMADFKTSSFFPFQVPWSHGLLAPAQSDITLWILLVLARPPQSPTGAWSQPREGQVGTVFSLYGTVLPIGEKKSNFYTQKGIKHWWLLLKKGFSKLSHIGKNQHLPCPVQTGSIWHQIPPSVHNDNHIVCSTSEMDAFDPCF
jgi:hypothetical protein